MYLLFLAIPLWSQEETAVAYRYHVPLIGTKTVSLANWSFTLEATAQEDQPYGLVLIQRDIRGREIGATDFGEQPAHGIFTWNSKAAGVSNRLRTLEIVSDKALNGILWMSNDVFGQINGVVLSQDLASELFIPHIPDLFFEVTTSFAVQGISGNQEPATIFFHLYDENRSLQQPVNLRTLWPSLGYFSDTPDVTLALGNFNSNLVPAWARLTSSNPQYRMAGFQTFSQEPDGDNLPQTAATELLGQGSPKGNVLISQREGFWTDEVVLTNPMPVEVQVSFEGFFHEYLDVLNASVLQSVRETVLLLPYEKKIFQVGYDLFADMQAPFVRLAYSAETMEEEPREAAIFALHFEKSLASEMGSAFFSNGGTLVKTWLTRGLTHESALEVVSLGRQELVFPDDAEEGTVPEWLVDQTILEMKFFDAEGVVRTTRLNLTAGDIYDQLTLDEIGHTFGREDLDAAMVLLRVIEGPPILAKVIARGINDIAVVNPYTVSPAPVEIATDGEIEVEK